MGTVTPLGTQVRTEARSQVRARATRQPERLWREVVGELLRDVRTGRGERITDVAGRAGISPQYLSEIERGRKDPSSEVLSAVCGALHLTAYELSGRVARRYAQVHAGLPARPGPLCLAA